MSGPGSALCGSCRLPLALTLLREGENACPACAAPITARLYPAAARSAEKAAGEAVQEAGESVCFFHAEKRAAAACGHCGRFVCSLCAIDFAGQTRCAACLEHKGKAREKAALEDRRTNYDSLALLFGWLPVVIYPIGIFFGWATGPLAIFMAIWAWRKPLAPTRRWRWRNPLAILFGLGQLVGAAWLYYLIFFNAGRR